MMVLEGDGQGWRWVSLALLGAWHGLNPAMGWLFGVALGLQRKSRKAVFQSLAPIALGHALAIAMAVTLVALLGFAMPISVLRWTAAAALVGFGLWRLRRLRHPSWVGMQVSFLDLTRWSWLMATAHGAGLMLVPVVVGLRPAVCGITAGSAPGEVFTLTSVTVVGATAVHTASHLAVSTGIAWLVYDRLGLMVLRSSWINLDFIWSCSLLIAGGLVLVTGALSLR
ncbi:MAG TPA: hypothetical protein VGD78_14340 [Chthoniobacterales bacterium]